jgi:hypothetical protein
VEGRKEGNSRILFQWNSIQCELDYRKSRAEKDEKFNGILDWIGNPFLVWIKDLSIFDSSILDDESIG